MPTRCLSGQDDSAARSVHDHIYFHHTNSHKTPVNSARRTNSYWENTLSYPRDSASSLAIPKVSVTAAVIHRTLQMLLSPANGGSNGGVWMVAERKKCGTDLPVTDVLVPLQVHVVQLIDRNRLRRAWIVRRQRARGSLRRSLAGGLRWMHVHSVGAVNCN